MGGAANELQGVSADEVRGEFAERLRSIAAQLDNAAEEIEALHEAGLIPDASIPLWGKPGLQRAVSMVAALPHKLLARVEEARSGMAAFKERKRENATRFREAHKKKPAKKKAK